MQSMYLNSEPIVNAAEAIEKGLLVDITEEVRAVDPQIRDRVHVSRRVHDDLLVSDEYMLSRPERVRDIAHPLRVIHWYGLHGNETSYLAAIVIVRRDGTYQRIQLRQVLLKGDETVVAVLMPQESLTLGPQPIDHYEEIHRAQSEHIEEDRDRFVRLFNAKPVDIPAAGRLAGADEYCRADDEALIDDGPDWAVGDHKHYAFNHSFLQVGLPAIVAETAANADKTTGVASQYLSAISDSYTAIIGFIQRHADQAATLASQADGPDRQRLEEMSRACAAIATRPPETFHEAVQLYKFMYRIRCDYHTATIGRLDQYLYPFYQADLDAGRLTPDEAMDLLAEIWVMFNRGQTLTNLMLAGQDREGGDATNALSYLMIDVALTLKMPEPYVNVRIHANTPESFIEKVADLHLQGHGHGTVYNDEVLIPGLVENLIPLDRARNYANDGCTELTIDGESCIDFFNMMMALKSVELMMFNGEQNVDVYDVENSRRPEWSDHLVNRNYWPICKVGYQSGDVTKMTSFEEVYDAFVQQYLFQIEYWMATFDNFVTPTYRVGTTSFVLAGTYPDCRHTGADPKRGGGYREKCLMGFVGNVPAAADCLAAIKRVVFEQQLCTMAELQEALRADFEGHEDLRQQLKHAPKFGNDDDAVDLIASGIVDHLIAHFKQSLAPHGKPYLLALYTDAFTGVQDIVGATPDGRKWGDTTGMHYAPVPGRALTGPTAVLQSAAKACLGAACGTAPVNVNLPPTSDDAAAEKRAAIGLINAAVEMGISVMTVARYDVDVLHKAQENPDAYQDLIVRVRGFSMRFTDLDPSIQEHIIARTRGLKVP
jgi:trans-4-hydroxy-L-proline dehydratase